MTVAVPSIAEVSMDKRALWISVRANDWTSERAIIAGNVIASNDPPFGCRIIYIHSNSQ